MIVPNRVRPLSPSPMWVAEGGGGEAALGSGSFPKAQFSRPKFSLQSAVWRTRGGIPPARSNLQSEVQHPSPCPNWPPWPPDLVPWRAGMPLCFPLPGKRCSGAEAPERVPGARAVAQEAFDGRTEEVLQGFIATITRLERFLQMEEFRTYTELTGPGAAGVGYLRGAGR